MNITFLIVDRETGRQVGTTTCAHYPRLQAANHIVGGIQTPIADRLCVQGALSTPPEPEQEEQPILA